MDPFERLLVALVEHIGEAWVMAKDTSSPLGELSGEAAALLQFYREQMGRAKKRAQLADEPVPAHWSHAWKARHPDL